MSQLGVVEAIFIGEKHGIKPGSVTQVEARAGHGLVGDRTFIAGGPASPKHQPDLELTLIERESIDALLHESNVVLDPAEARRNILTSGVPLNHLVGREFSVGSVRARGIRLCEPCSHLEKLTSKEVRQGLVHRGGLRAEILTDGMIRVGDPVVVHPRTAGGSERR